MAAATKKIRFIGKQNSYTIGKNRFTKGQVADVTADEAKAALATGAFEEVKEQKEENKEV